MTTRSGTLYLIPVALGEDNALAVLPGATLEAVRKLRAFVVEDAKSARRFLKAAGYPHSLQETRFQILNEHARESELDALLAPLLAGEDRGLMSEAGCPGVADPGEMLVRCALDAGIRVVPLVGPCSILLALMASGMSGQHFTFHGYLPVDKAQRANAIKALEVPAETATQIFIETPYRSAALFHALLEQCRGDTRVCVATDLTLRSEFVLTRTVAEWRKQPPELDRRPVVFLVYRGRP
ncbi:MAG: SAM-dependent methyltransferase [Betaproteobacteria bacterium]|nr:SAM-dependent methyltransferase [Betaproteobacteria bacterium]MDH3436952.1 SAM-dependent methyltransferase [Betaproteobacteria bacterium]